MLKRSPFKRRAPKKRTGHNKAYLTACCGEPCRLLIPGVCIGGTDTTVPAHSNQSRHGKGMGLKARDEFTVPACHACHAEIDQGGMLSREAKFEIWDRAYSAWEPVRGKKLTVKSATETAGKTKAGINGARTPTPAYCTPERK